MRYRIPIVNAREDLLNSGQGIIAETFPTELATSSQALTTSCIYFQSISLRAGETITNIISVVGTAGTATLAVYQGIYTSAAALAASTTNQVNSLSSTGQKTTPLAATYTVPTSGLYYIATLSSATTTNPAFVKGPSLFVASAGAIGSGVKRAGIQTGQATLPGTATIAAPAATTDWPFWFGVS